MDKLLDILYTEWYTYFTSLAFLLPSGEGPRGMLGK